MKGDGEAVDLGKSGGGKLGGVDEGEAVIEITKNSKSRKCLW